MMWGKCDPDTSRQCLCFSCHPWWFGFSLWMFVSRFSFKSTFCFLMSQSLFWFAMQHPPPLTPNLHHHILQHHQIFIIWFAPTTTTTTHPRSTIITTKEISYYPANIIVRKASSQVHIFIFSASTSQMQCKPSTTTSTLPWSPPASPRKYLGSNTNSPPHLHPHI